MDISSISSSLAQAVQSHAVQSQPARHHGHHHVAMDAAAQALGMSTTDLRTALQSGQSLSSLAASKGVSQDSLISAISSAAPAPGRAGEPGSRARSAVGADAQAAIASAIRPSGSTRSARPASTIAAGIP